MVYKLGLSAEKGWLKLRGFRRLAEIINGVKFIYGIDEKKSKANRILSLLFNRAYFDINFQMFPGSVSLPITSPLPKPAAIIMISFVLMMNTWAFWLPIFPGTGCPVGVTMAMMHVVLWSCGHFYPPFDHLKKYWKKSNKAFAVIKSRGISLSLFMTLSIFPLGS
jgi:hypothetical protein